jgi:hypothetical protein
MGIVIQKVNYFNVHSPFKWYCYHVITFNMLLLLLLLLGCLHGTIDPKSCHNLVIFSRNKISKYGDIIGKGLVVKMCD